MKYMNITPLETTYNGYRFRSRLEARWALFFDKSDIEYLYEPQGFTLSDGTKYLPDFYLTRQRRWVEIKYDVLNDFDFNKAKLLVKETEIPLIILDKDPKSTTYNELYVDEDGDVMSRFINLVPEDEKGESFILSAMLEGDEMFIEHGFEKQVEAAKSARNERFGIFD